MKNFDNHFLFSETYINDYIKINSSKNKQFDSLKNTFSAIKEWHEPFVDGDYSDEEWVEEFIDLTLDVLGFKKKTDDRVRILYTNTIASSENPIAICYVLEKNEDLDCKVKGNYNAYKTINAAKNNALEWAMLTNGYKWRIYNTKNVSCYENYLEVDIEDSIKKLEEPDTAFMLFHLFFNVKTYYKTENGELEIENIKDLSDKKAETIENFLRGKVEEILKDLCYGLKENMNFTSYEEQDRKNIYNDSVILLFRLLFIGYAESRKLLPCSEDDTEYVKNSFFTICNDAKEILNSGKAVDIKDGFEFWDRIDEYLRIYVDNTYDGGLFENIDKPVLDKYKISNGYLIKCLAEMTYYRDKKTGLYNEAIEYKDLSVRNLGSIYEGLLEYNLFIAKERLVIRKSKGKVTYIEASNTTLKKSDEANIIEAGGIYLSQDALERKDTGSYYTPEDVVEYIVTNAVGKRILELKEELKEVLKEKTEEMLIEPSPNRKISIKKEIDNITLDFIEKRILKLSIIDSAMGSGHFLVNATYNVANSIVEIICENDWINEDIPTDISYWKRRVVQNCIYGIDINKLAVYLARVSLWLISASNDKALSFIDHHLKEGNSIIGTDRKHVETKESNTGVISLFDVEYMDFMGGILSKYKELSSISGNSKNEVEKQKELYKEIQQDLELVKKKYDYYLASQYNGCIEDNDKYALLMRSNNMQLFEEEEIKEILKIAKEKKFFHWELEFPEVIMSGGFDIAIGNPPYVEVNSAEYEFCVKEVIKTKNLYSYIIYNNLKYLKTNGKLSYIVLMALISSKKMKALRDILQGVKGKVSFMNVDSATYPGRLFDGLMIRLTIVNVEKELSKENKIFSTNYLRFFQYERKNLFNNANYQFVDKSFIKESFIPKIGTELDSRILSKINLKTKKTMGDFILKQKNDNYIYVRNTGAVYYCMAFNEPPYYMVDGEPKVSSTLSKVYFEKEISKYIPLCIFHSSIFYWFWTIYSDCYHFTSNDLKRFNVDLKELQIDKENFEKLYFEILQSLDENKALVRYKKSFGNLEYHEFRHRNSKLIFDKVDLLLAKYYGLTEEETDYIINYDIKYRVGDKTENTLDEE